MSDEPIDEKIKAKRAELRALKGKEAKLRAELAVLFKEKAQHACPVPFGSRVQYKDGRWGVVTRIGFFADFLRVLDETAPVHWTVEGLKVTKAGEPGVKQFHGSGPATHTLISYTFEPKPMSGYLGINDNET